MKVYEAIVAACEAESDSPMFALMGDGNMELLASAHDRRPDGIVHARHENAAVAMADGWARASGQVGVCTVTCGPGMTQIATSTVVASRHGTPLVILVGDTPREAAHHLQELVQAPLAAATEAAFVPLRTADTVLDDVRRAFLLARERSGPVVVSMPMDLQQDTFSWGWDYEPSSTVAARVAPVAPADEELRRVLAAVDGAQRVVILAGRGALDAGEVLRGLADDLDALLATSLRAKGLFEGHPWDLGVAGAFSTAHARERFVEADLILAFGAGLGYFTTEGGYLFPEATVIQVDVRPRGWHEGQRTAHHHVAGDSRLVATRLRELLAERAGRSGYRHALPDGLVAATPGERPVGDDGLHPTTALQVVDDHLPSMTLVVGAGHFWNFAVPAFGGRAPTDYVFTYDFGCIGQALPTAMGAALHTGRAAVVEGDGSLLMNLQELETLARHRVPVLCFVMNDGAYGAEVHKLRAKGLAGDQADFGRTDLAGVASALGLDAETVTELGQIPTLIDKFVAGSSPLVVDLQISPTVIAPTYRRLYYGEVD